MTFKPCKTIQIDASGAFRIEEWPRKTMKRTEWICEFEAGLTEVKRTKYVERVIQFGRLR
jgi:N-acetyl-gamma-glutamylphosphate reductase